jgi:hypothetical protein
MATSERDQLSRLSDRQAGQGWGYLAAYKVMGRWCPAGMQVYDTREEALAFASKHHPHAKAYAAVPFRPEEG